MMTMRLSCIYTEIRGFKDFGVTSLTFWGHVTSSVTWPLDSTYVVSYWWSIGTISLSCTITKILGSKDKGVTSLTFWGHVTSSITWPSVGTFLLVVNDDHASILHVYGDTGLQRFWDEEFDLLGSRDVISYVTVGPGICGFLLVVHWNHVSILHRYGVIKLQSCICPC